MLSRLFGAVWGAAASTMKDKVKYSGEVEPIRTGRPFGERRPAGKIYAVDPQAVARLKAIMAEKEKLRETAEEAGKSDIMGNILRTQHERQAALNARKRKPEIPANLAREWHITFLPGGLFIGGGGGVGGGGAEAAASALAGAGAAGFAAGGGAGLAAADAGNDLK